MSRERQAIGDAVKDERDGPRLTAPLLFDLFAYYLNTRRLAELAGPIVVSRALAEVRPGVSDKATADLHVAACKDVLLDWLDANRETIRPLEESLLAGTLKPGLLFTASGTFTCTGIRTMKASSSPRAYRDIPLPERRVRLLLRVHRDHVAPGSPGDLLTGQVPDLYVVGIVDKVDGDHVEAIPIAMGKLTDRSRRNEFIQGPHSPEMHIDRIDTFARAAEEGRPTSAQMARLRQTPEDEIKHAFAAIIGEELVPKDWGGERSDLFSTHVLLDGQRVSTAFALKGPARRGPMSLAHLGKRGDQIIRLFTEPADLLMLQHHDSVRAEVRQMMRVFALHQRARYCVIDGFDTVRILRAYSKCGFRATRHRKLAV